MRQVAIQTTVTAPDISCDGCANSIKRALGKVPGVSGVQVDVPTKKVTVEHDGTQVPRETIIAALDRAGFPAE